MVNLHLNYLFQDENKVNEIVQKYQAKVIDLNKSLQEKTCIYGHMLGWMDYPFNYDKKEFTKLINLANEWKNNQKVKNVVLLGIGGSYIGIRAAIDFALNEFTREKEIYYVSSLSSSYIADLVQKLKNQDFYLVVVSKSGTTLETAVAFRLFYKLLVQNSGSERAKERIVAITDKEKGVLRQIVQKHELNAFTIPDDVGGRFSAITPVGLFVSHVMGLDANKILEGARKALIDTQVDDLNTNLAYKYAVLRHYLHTEMKKDIEFMCVNENALVFLAEHTKQIFAESEGKQNKALLPYDVLYTTDLHSIGQFMQEGKNIFFETHIEVKNPLNDIKIESFMEDIDGLGYLNNKKLDSINKIARLSTIEAHFYEANVPIIRIEVNSRNEKTYGYLYAWFSKAVAMSGLLLDVNPFDQPGVEAYKKRMFAKLKK